MDDTVVRSGEKDELSHMYCFKYLKKQQRIISGLMVLQRRLSILNGYTETPSGSDAGQLQNTETFTKKTGSIQYGQPFRHIIWGMQAIVIGVKGMAKDIITLILMRLKRE